MAYIHHAAKEIVLKLVYYGPAMSGKTTNLVQIHAMVSGQTGTKMYQLNTAQDRTLFFDLLPLTLAAVSDYKIKLKLYTVPGQIYYNATRRVVLRQASGVVFVADSQKNKLEENLESLSNLKENLKANNLSYSDIPLVLQYNKQDMEGLSESAELDRVLNGRAVPRFLAIANKHEGVLETFVCAIKETASYALGKLGISKDPLQSENILREIEQNIIELATQPGISSQHDGEEKASTVVTRLEGDHLEKAIQTPATGQPAITPADTLLESAVQANLKTADLLVWIDEANQRLERQLKEQILVSEVGKAIVSDVDVTSILSTSIDMAKSFLEAKAASVLTEDRSGNPEVKHLAGTEKEPLLQIWKEETFLNFYSRLGTSKTIGMSDLSEDEKEVFTNQIGINSFVASLLKVSNRPVGIINFYFVKPRQITGETERFVTTFANHLAVAMENRNLYEELKESNEILGTMGEFAKKLNQTLRENDLYSIVTSLLPEILETPFCAIYLSDKNGTLRLAAHNYPRIDKNTPTRIDPSSDKQVSRIMKDKGCLHMEELPQAMHFPDYQPSGPGALAIVMKVGEEPVGTVILSGKTGKGEFTARDKKIAENLGEHMASAISNMILFNRTLEASKRDGLTGLYTHRTFHEILEQEVYKASRYESRLSLVMGDIDHFKNFNDTYGHQAGDLVLKTVASNLVEISRKSDYVARYGGEEFAIILPYTGFEGALKVANRYLQHIREREIMFEGKRLTVTASFGVAELKKGMSRAELLKAADEALYKAKEDGRNRVEPHVSQAVT